MEELRHLDEVAYVRFASVYRSFQDVEAFHEEIERLRSHAPRRRRAWPHAQRDQARQPRAAAAAAGGRTPARRAEDLSAGNARAASHGSQHRMFSIRPHRDAAGAGAGGARLETTDPNPRVGCVIAQRRPHHRGGLARARRGGARGSAWRCARPAMQAAGATAYVTLEPCSHTGARRRASRRCIAARVARVVYAVDDPNPLRQRAGRRGAARGRHRRRGGAAGSRGRASSMSASSSACSSGRPWVRLKLAMSLDGRTALANGASQWITGEAARAATCSAGVRAARRS